MEDKYIRILCFLDRNGIRGFYNDDLMLDEDEIVGWEYELKKPSDVQLNNITDEEIEEMKELLLAKNTLTRVPVLTDRQAQKLIFRDNQFYYDRDLKRYRTKHKGEWD